MRVFQVNSSGITIKNLTIKNAKYVINAKYPDDDGGAIYFTKSGTLTYCNFINNTVKSDGGAVYFDKDTTGTLSYCNFINNTASSWGGAVSFGNNGFVINCTFVNNAARSWGGAIKFGENATLRNCKFYNGSLLVVVLFIWIKMLLWNTVILLITVHLANILMVVLLSLRVLIQLYL